MQQTNSALAEALEEFKRATSKLSEVWQRDVQGDAMGDTYPSYLPSFDEFNADVVDMEIKPPALTHDEIIAYALAHAAATLDFPTQADEDEAMELLYQYGHKIGVEVRLGDEYQRAVLHRFDPERVS